MGRYGAKGTPSETAAVDIDRVLDHVVGGYALASVARVREARVIETEIQQRLPEGVTHGEAVAMGMVLAAKLADRYYRNDRNDPTELEAKISNDLWDCNIPCYCPYSIEEMAQIMKKDKKAEGGKVHFVLPKAIGQVEIVALTVDEVCRLMK